MTARETIATLPPGQYYIGNPFDTMDVEDLLDAPIESIGSDGGLKSHRGHGFVLYRVGSSGVRFRVDQDGTIYDSESELFGATPEILWRAGTDAAELEKLSRVVEFPEAFECYKTTSPRYSDDAVQEILHFGHLVIDYN